MKIGRYTLKLTDYQEGDTPNYQYGRATLEVRQDGRLVRTMRPERRFYKSGDGQSTTEVELFSRPSEDLYVVLAGPAGDGSRYEITAHVNPLVWWVWFGAGVLCVGTLIALLPDRRADQGSAAWRQPESAAAGAGVRAG